MDNPNPTYACRMQPVGAEILLELEPQALSVDRNGKIARFPYRDIQAIELIYQPRGLHLTGFRTRVHVGARKPVVFDDTTFSGALLQERRAAAYRAFTTDLVERVRRENPRALLVGGRPMWLQAATVLFGGGFAIFMASLALRALSASQWLPGLMLAVFTTAFVAWTWAFVSRNRLCDIRKDGIPADLLPRGG